MHGLTLIVIKILTYIKRGSKVLRYNEQEYTMINAKKMKKPVEIKITYCVE
jgi:hypothetical protein